MLMMELPKRHATSLYGQPAPRWAPVYCKISRHDGPARVTAAAWLNLRDRGPFDATSLARGLAGHAGSGLSPSRPKCRAMDEGPGSNLIRYVRYLKFGFLWRLPLSGGDYKWAGASVLRRR